MNSESEVVDDIHIEPEVTDDDRPIDEKRASEAEEVSEEALGDTQLGQDLGELITEIRRDEEKFRRSGAAAENGDEPDPFDPRDFSLDTPFGDEASETASTSTSGSRAAGENHEQGAAEVLQNESTGVEDAASETARASGARAESDAAASTIAGLVSEIETALQRFTQAERLRADQLIAEKETQVAEQYRKLRSLADKVAKQKAQIQEAKNELKAKLELADRLHIEFDGIRQVLDGKLGALDQLEKEDEAAE